MLEMLLCSLLTILPDYLYRRYVQGKRFGKEITLYSVWFELSWGITACLILTVLLITIDVLQSSFHDQRHTLLQNRPDHARNDRTGRRDQYRLSTSRSSKVHRSSGSTVRSRRPRSRPRAARSPRSMRQWWWREPMS